jgi:Fe-coproporphyrin III synthase
VTTQTLSEDAVHATAAKEPFLFLYITEKCQLRCQHCYMGDRLNAERRMSPDLVEQILSTLRIAYGQYKVYLLGGEPTTHPQLDQILDICVQQNYKVVLTSNGIIPAKVWPLLEHRLDSFSFSMDGASLATHEAMRGPNTFRPLIASIRKAVGTGFQTRAIFTVTMANRVEVFDAIDLADSLGLEMLSFHYFTPTGLGLDKPHYQIDPEAWMALCEQIRTYAAGRRLRVFYPPSFVPADQLPLLAKQGYRGCTARNLERLAIFPDRRVYICSAFFDTDLHYGIFRNGVIEPRHGAGTTELTLVNQISNNCRGCGNSGICGGGCAAYDHLGRTLTSADCDRATVPICPLWSMPAEPDAAEHRLVDLR